MDKLLAYKESAAEGLVALLDSFGLEYRSLVS